MRGVTHIPIFQMSKQRHREDKGLAPSHMVQRVELD